jgi:Permuted papain-like amidase enzyme, YaeF/YiiX, C92 family
MKLLPKGKWALIRFGVLFALLVGVVIVTSLPALGWHLLHYSPREGDIVFQSLPRGDLVNAIEGITQSPFSHCGVVMKNTDGAWVVHESIGMVRETPLYLWIVRGRGARIDAWRTRDAALADPAKLLPALKHYAGRPYDYSYAPGDDKIYCSELVFLAYRDATGVELGTWEKLGDLNWRPYERFIRDTEGGKLPLDRPMVSPVSVTRSPLLEKVY